MDFEIQIDHTLMPDYYPSFHCTANACQYTCCQNWNIYFSKKDYLTLKHAPNSPAMKACMAQSLQRLRGEGVSEQHYAKFKLNEQGYCSFLNEEGLCSLQLECGSNTLAKICQVFPRREFFTPGGAVECSCSTGCEEVVRLLLVREDGLSFLQTPLLPENQKQQVFADSTGLLRGFSPIREMCIDILQARAHTLPHRMLLLGMALQDLTARPANQLDDWLEDWLACSRARLEDAVIRETLNGLHGDKRLFVGNNMKQIFFSPLTNQEFANLKGEILSVLGLHPDHDHLLLNTGHYIAAEQGFQKAFGDMEYLFENVMVNLFFQFQLPFLPDPNEIWKSYVNFCNLYSMLRFLTICGCAQEYTQDRLVYVLTRASRTLFHTQSLQTVLSAEYEQNESNTLAHMAILVCD